MNYVSFRFSKSTNIKEYFFSVFWNFECRNKILLIPPVSECANWCNRVVIFRLKVFFGIRGPKLKILEILNFELIVVNI